MTAVKRRLYSDSDIIYLHKDLDDVSCPICMDHPHNAVLLRCSSYEKGCRSFICDTSYRHSNCLDRFKKVRTTCRTSPTSSSSDHRNPGDRSDANSVVHNNINEAADTDRNEIDSALTIGLLHHGARQVNIQDLNRPLESRDESEILLKRVEVEELNEDSSSDSKLTLKCPLCSGTVLGWEVPEEARNYLNMKKRGCSRELCSFTGNYNELRKHARRVHPTTCPSDVDPLRERAWQHLERQREYGDIVSAIHSATPGAVVVGDYVIENGEGRLPLERGGGMGGDAGAPWWSTLLLFQMIGSIDNVGEPRGRSRASTRHRRAAGGSSSDRRYLWGENLLGLRNDDDNQNDNLHHLSLLRDVDGDAFPVPRSRRRLSRSRSNE